MNKQCIEADMGAWGFWKSWPGTRDFARSAPPRQRSGRQTVSVQHFGLPGTDMASLQQVFDRLGRVLGIAFELRVDDGELVLLDLPSALHMPSDLVLAIAEGRPVLLGAAPQAGDGTWADAEAAAGAAAARRDRLLLSQLRDLPLVRQRATAWMGERWLDHEGGGFLGRNLPPGRASPAAPDRLPTGAARAPAPQRAAGNDPLALLRALTAGRRDRGLPALQASYGPGAHLLVRFDSATVTLDRTAQRLLRVHRRLPYVSGAPDDTMLPAAAAVPRSLDETIWDLGIACGTLPLLKEPQEPADWWRSPLRIRADAAIGLYSRAPRHLELARCLQEGPATPAVLGRRARVDTADMRAFVQACLALELVAWFTGDEPPV